MTEYYCSKCQTNKAKVFIKGTPYCYECKPGIKEFIALMSIEQLKQLESPPEQVAPTQTKPKTQHEIGTQADLRIK